MRLPLMFIWKIWNPFSWRWQRIPISLFSTVVRRNATLKKNFNLTIFITGFFGNAILAILLTILGQKLNVDIYLAAIIVFVGRMFTNLAIIRRYYIDIVMKKIEDKKSKKDNLKEEKTE